MSALNLSSLKMLKVLIQMVGVGIKKRSFLKELFVMLALLLSWLTLIEYVIKAVLYEFHNGDNMGGALYILHVAVKHTSFVFNRNLFEGFLIDMEQLVLSNQLKVVRKLNQANSRVWKLTTIVICSNAIESTLGSIFSILMYIADSNTTPTFLSKYSLLGLKTHPLMYWLEDNIMVSVVVLITVIFYLMLFLSMEYSRVLYYYLSSEMQDLQNIEGSERVTRLKSNALLFSNILRFRKKMLSLLAGLSILEISCSSLTICFCLYSVATMNKFSPLSFMQVASLLTTNILPFLLCYVGQKLEDANNQMIRECFNCGWEHWTSSERKMLSQFLTGATQPIQFHYKLTFVINYSKFGAILQGVWSYYAVLNRMVGNATI